MNKGFAAVFLIVAIVGLFAVGAGLYFYDFENTQTDINENTADKKLTNDNNPLQDSSEDVADSKDETKAVDTGNTKSDDAIAVSVFNQNREKYIGQEIKVIGVSWIDISYSASPCEVGKNCQSYEERTLLILDEHEPASQLAVYRNDRPLCIKENGGFDCGGFVRGKTVVATGAIKKSESGKYYLNLAD